MDAVTKIRSGKLTELNSMLMSISAVQEGREVIDFKLFDRQLVNNGLQVDDEGKYSTKQGDYVLKSNTIFFDRAVDDRTIQALSGIPADFSLRQSNVIQGGKADEPYMFDRVAVDVEVFDATANNDALVNVDGLSALANQVYRQIMNSGKLTLIANGKELNYADPVAYAGSSIALDSTELKNVYNKKTPKFIDPAIYLPETTSFTVRLDFNTEVKLPQCVSVAITVSLLGYKFLKNS